MCIRDSSSLSLSLSLSRYQPCTRIPLSSGIWKIPVTHFWRSWIFITTSTIPWWTNWRNFTGSTSVKKIWAEMSLMVTMFYEYLLLKSDINITKINFTIHIIIISNNNQNGRSLSSHAKTVARRYYHRVGFPMQSWVNYAVIWMAKSCLLYTSRCV